MDDKLITYVENNLKKGYKKEEIRKTLIESGYSNDKIEAVFKEFERKKRINPLTIIGGIMLVVMIVLAYSFLSQPKTFDMKKSEIDNIYYSEQVSGKEFVSREDVLDKFIRDCKITPDIINMTGRGCDITTLFALSRKFANVNLETVDAGTINKLQPVLDVLNTAKSNLLNMDFTVSDSSIRLSIESLINFKMITPEEMDRIEKEYFSSLSQEDLNKTPCFLYWDQVMYFQDILGISTMSEAMQKTPEYTSGLSGACDKISKIQFEGFCTPRDVEMVTSLCAYNRYLIIKKFCGKMDSGEVNTATVLINDKSSSRDVDILCKGFIKNTLGDS